MAKNSNIKITLTLCWLLFAVHYTDAQDTLQSMTSINRSTYVPVIADASKIEENPVVSDSTQKMPVSPYSIHSKKINTFFSIDPIAPAQMLGEPLTKLYNSYVKVGMGNYASPYGELWVNTMRSKNVSGGVRLKHFSSRYDPKGYGYAGFNDDEISAYGKKFLRKHSLIGNADYFRNTVHLYGYDPDSVSLTKAVTEQRYNFIRADAELKSHYTNATQINHDIKLGGYSFMDRYKTFENNATLSGTIQTSIEKKYMLNVMGGFDYYNYHTPVDTINNTIVRLEPYVLLADSNYYATLGIKVAIDKFDSTKYHFYPDFYFSYDVYENIIVPYAGLTGGLQKNSFRNFTSENPFVLSSLQMVNSSKKYEVYGGIKGTLSSTTAFNFKVSQQEMNDLPMYVDDTITAYQNQFGVIYDDVILLNIHGEAAYQLREKLRINLSGDYFNYKMKNEQKAWYRPQVYINLTGNYNLEDKIIIKAGVFYIGNQFAKTYVSDTMSISGISVEPLELKGFIDINLGAEYRYNKRLGFFLNFNNIANVKYYRWRNYPTQRFSVLGGLSFSF